MVSPSSWLLCNSNQQPDFFQMRSCPPCKVESILSLCSESSCSMGGRSILPGFLWRTWSSWWWLRRHHCALYLVTWRHLSWKARGWILLAQCWGLSWGWYLWMAREWYSSGDSSETACSYFFILKIWLSKGRQPILICQFSTLGESMVSPDVQVMEEIWPTTWNVQHPHKW